MESESSSSDGKDISRDTWHSSVQFTLVYRVTYASPSQLLSVMLPQAKYRATTAAVSSSVARNDPSTLAPVPLQILYDRAK